MVILHNILCQHTPLTPEVWSKDLFFFFSEISCVAYQIKGNETGLIILMSTEVEVNDFLLYGFPTKNENFLLFILLFKLCSTVRLRTFSQVLSTVIKIF